MTTLEQVRRIGYDVEANDDKLRLVWRGEGKRPPASVVAPLIDELRAHKAEILAALRECPSCGIPAAVAKVARKKMRLDTALTVCEDHQARCQECDPGRLRYCAEGDRLRSVYFDTWLAYHGPTAARWDVWDGGR